MTRPLEKDAPQLLLAQWKNRDISVIDVLEDFELWVEDYMPDADDKQIDFLSCAIKMYLLNDDKSQRVIAKEENLRLKEWTKSCGVGQ